jgi:hypothetical protein
MRRFFTNFMVIIVTRSCITLAVVMHLALTTVRKVSIGTTLKPYHTLSGFTFTSTLQPGELVRAKYEQCMGVKAENYVARNHPLPLTAGEVLTVQTVLALFTALFLLIPLCYIPAAFSVFLVRERASKAHHLQLVSGVNRQVRS